MKGKISINSLFIIILTVLLLGSFMTLCTDDNVFVPVEPTPSEPPSMSDCHYVLERQDENHHVLTVNEDYIMDKVCTEGSEIHPILSLTKFRGEAEQLEDGTWILNFAEFNFPLESLAALLGDGIEGSLIFGLKNTILDPNGQLDTDLYIDIPLIENMPIIIRHQLKKSQISNPGFIQIDDSANDMVLLKADLVVREFELSTRSNAPIDSDIVLTELTGFPVDLTLSLNGTYSIGAMLGSGQLADMNIKAYGHVEAKINTLIEALGPMLGIESLELPLGIDLTPYNVSLDVASEENPVSLTLAANSMDDIGLTLDPNPDPISAALINEEERLNLELLLQTLDFGINGLSANIQLDAYGNLSLATDIADLFVVVADESEHLSLGLGIGGEIAFGLGGGDVAGGGGDVAGGGGMLDGLDISLSLINSPASFSDIYIAIKDNQSPPGNLGFELDFNALDITLPDQFDIDIVGNASGEVTFGGDEIAKTIEVLMGKPFPVDLRDYSASINAGTIGLSVLASGSGPIDINLTSDPNNPTSLGLDINPGIDLLDVAVLLDGNISIPSIDFENLTVDINNVTIGLTGGIADTPFEFVADLVAGIADMGSFGPLLDLLDGTYISARIPENVTIPLAYPITDTLDIVIDGDLDTLTIDVEGVAAQNDISLALWDSTKSQWDLNLDVDVTDLSITDINDFAFDADVDVFLNGFGVITGDKINQVLGTLGGELPVDIDLGAFDISVLFDQIQLGVEATAGSDVELTLASALNSGLSMDLYGSNFLDINFGVNGFVLIPMEGGEVTFGGSAPDPEDVTLSINGILNECPIGDLLALVVPILGEDLGNMIAPISFFLAETNVSASIPGLDISAAGPMSALEIEAETSADIVLTVEDAATALTESTYNLSIEAGLPAPGFQLNIDTMEFNGNADLTINGGANLLGSDISDIIEEIMPEGLPIDISNFGIGLSLSELGISANASSGSNIVIDISDNPATPSNISIDRINPPLPLLDLFFNVNGRIEADIASGVIDLNPNVTLSAYGSLSSFPLGDFIELAAGLIGDIDEFIPLLNIFADAEISATIGDAANRLLVVASGPFDALVVDVTCTNLLAITLYDNIPETTMNLQVGLNNLNLHIELDPFIFNGGLTLALDEGPAPVPAHALYLDGNDLQAILDILNLGVPLDASHSSGLGLDLTLNIDSPMEVDLTLDSSSDIQLSMPGTNPYIDLLVDIGPASISLLDIHLKATGDAVVSMTGGTFDIGNPNPLILSLYGGLGPIDFDPYIRDLITGFGIDLTPMDPIVSLLDESVLTALLATAVDPLNVEAQGTMDNLNVSASCNSDISLTLVDVTPQTTIDLAVSILPGLTLDIVLNSPSPLTFDGQLDIGIDGDLFLYGDDLQNLLTALGTGISLDVSHPTGIGLDIGVTMGSTMYANLTMDSATGIEITLPDTNPYIDILADLGPASVPLLDFHVLLKGDAFIDPATFDITIGTPNPLQALAYGTLGPLDFNPYLTDIITGLGLDLGSMAPVLDLFNEAVLSGTVANDVDPLTISATGPIDAIVIDATCASVIGINLVDNTVLTSETEFDFGLEIKPGLNVHAEIGSPIVYNGGLSLGLSGNAVLCGDDLQPILDSLGTGLTLDLSHAGLGMDITLGMASEMLVNATLDSATGIQASLPGTNPYIDLAVDMGPMDQILVDIHAKLIGDAFVPMPAGDIEIGNPNPLQAMIYGNLGPINFDPYLLDIVDGLGIDLTSMTAILDILNDAVLSGNIATDVDPLTISATGLVTNLVIDATCASNIAINVLDVNPDTTINITAEIKPGLNLHLELGPPMVYNGGLQIGILGNAFLYGDDLQDVVDGLGAGLTFDLSHATGIGLDITLGMASEMLIDLSVDSATGLLASMPTTNPYINLTLDVGALSDILLDFNVKITGDVEVPLPTGTIEIGSPDPLNIYAYGSIGPVSFDPNMMDIITGLGMDVSSIEPILDIFNESTITGLIGTVADPVTITAVGPVDALVVDISLGSSITLAIEDPDIYAVPVVDTGMYLELGITLPVPLHLELSGSLVYSGELSLAISDGAEDPGLFLNGNDLQDILTGLSLGLSLDVSHATGLGMDIGVDFDAPMVVNATLDSATGIEASLPGTNPYIDLVVDMGPTDQVLVDIHAKLSGDVLVPLPGDIEIGNPNPLNIALYGNLGPITFDPYINDLIDGLGFDLGSIDPILDLLGDAEIAGNLATAADPLIASASGVIDSLVIDLSCNSDSTISLVDVTPNTTMNLGATLYAGLTAHVEMGTPLVYNGALTLGVAGNAFLDGDDLQTLLEGLGGGTSPIDPVDLSHATGLGMDITAGMASEMLINVVADSATGIAANLPGTNPYINLIVDMGPTSQVLVDINAKIVGDILVPMPAGDIEIGNPNPLEVSLYGTIGPITFDPYINDLIDGLGFDLGSIDPILDLLGDAEIAGNLATAADPLIASATGVIDSLVVDLSCGSDSTFTLEDTVGPTTMDLSATLYAGLNAHVEMGTPLVYNGSLTLGIDGNAFLDGDDLQTLLVGLGSGTSPIDPVDLSHATGLGMDISVSMASEMLINVVADSATGIAANLPGTNPYINLIVDMGPTSQVLVDINAKIVGDILVPMPAGDIEIGNPNPLEVSLYGTIGPITFDPYINDLIDGLGFDLGSIDPILDLLGDAEIAGNLATAADPLIASATGVIDSLVVDLSCASDSTFTLEDTVGPTTMDLSATLYAGLNAHVEMGTPLVYNGSLTLGIGGNAFLDGDDLQTLLVALGSGTSPIDPVDLSHATGLGMDISVSMASEMLINVTADSLVGIAVTLPGTNPYINLIVDMGPTSQVLVDINAKIDGDIMVPMPAGDIEVGNPNPLNISLYGTLGPITFDPYINDLIDGLGFDLGGLDPILDLLGDAQLSGNLATAANPLIASATGVIDSLVVDLSCASDSSISVVDVVGPTTMNLSATLYAGLVAHLEMGTPLVYSGSATIGIAGNAFLDGDDLQDMLVALGSGTSPLDPLDVSHTTGLGMDITVGMASEMLINITADSAVGITANLPGTNPYIDLMVDMGPSSQVLVDIHAKVSGDINVPIPGDIEIGVPTPLDIALYGTIGPITFDPYINDIIDGLGFDLGGLDPILDLLGDAEISGNLANAVDPLIASATGTIDSLVIDLSCASDSSLSVVDVVGPTTMNLSATLYAGLVAHVEMGTPLVYSGSATIGIAGNAFLDGDDLQDMLVALGSGTSPLDPLDVSHATGLGMDITVGMASEMLINITADSAVGITANLPGTNPYIDLMVDMGPSSQVLFDFHAKISGDINIPIPGDIEIGVPTPLDIALYGTIGPIDFDPYMTDIIDGLGFDLGDLDPILNLLGDAEISGNIANMGDPVIASATGTLDALVVDVSCASNSTLSVLDVAGPTTMNLNATLYAGWNLHVELGTPLVYSGALSIGMQGNLYLYGDDIQALLVGLGGGTSPLDPLDVAHGSGLGMDITLSMASAMDINLLLDSAVGIEATLPGTNPYIGLTVDMGPTSQELVDFNAKIDGSVFIPTPAGDIVIGQKMDMSSNPLNIRAYGTLGAINFDPYLTDIIAGLGMDLGSFQPVIDLLSQVVISGNIATSANPLVASATGTLDALVVDAYCNSNSSISLVDGAGPTTMSLTATLYSGWNLHFELGTPAVYNGNLTVGLIGNADLYGDDLQDLLEGFGGGTSPLPLNLAHTGVDPMGLDIAVSMGSAMMVDVILDSAQGIEADFRNTNPYITLNVDIGEPSSYNLLDVSAKITGSIVIPMPTGDVTIGEKLGGAPDPLRLALYGTLGPIPFDPLIVDLLAALGTDLTSLEFLTDQLVQTWLQGWIATSGNPFTIQATGTLDNLDISYVNLPPPEYITLRLYDTINNATNRMRMDLYIQLSLTNVGITITDTMDLMYDLLAQGTLGVRGYIENFHLQIGDIATPPVIDAYLDLLVGASVPHVTGTAEVPNYNGVYPMSVPANYLVFDLDKPAGSYDFEIETTMTGDALYIHADDDGATGVAGATGNEIEMSICGGIQTALTRVTIDFDPGSTSFLSYADLDINAFIWVSKLAGQWILDLLGGSLDLMGFEALIENMELFLEIGSSAYRYSLDMWYDDVDEELDITINYHPSAYWGTLKMKTRPAAGPQFTFVTGLAHIHGRVSVGMDFSNLAIRVLSGTPLVLELKGNVNMIPEVFQTFSELAEILGTMLNGFMAPNYTGSQYIDVLPVLTSATLTGVVSNITGPGIPSKQGGYPDGDTNPMRLTIWGDIGISDQITIRLDNTFIKLNVDIAGMPYATMPNPGVQCSANCYRIYGDDLGLNPVLEQDFGWLGTLWVDVRYLHVTQLRLGVPGSDVLNLLLTSPNNSRIVINAGASPLELGVGSMHDITLNTYRNHNMSSRGRLDLHVEARPVKIESSIGINPSVNADVDGPHDLHAVNTSGDLTNSPAWAVLYRKSTTDSIWLKGAIGTKLHIEFPIDFGVFGTLMIPINFDVPILKPTDGDASCLIGNCP